MSKSKTKAEKLHLSRVAALGCIVCRNLDYGESPAEIHHCSSGTGLSLKVKQGSILLIRSGGELQFAKLMGRSFITVEGESIEGDAMDEVEVLGVATHVINDMRQDDSPV